MEKRLAYVLIVVGWAFMISGGVIFCSAVWNVISPGQAGPNGKFVDAAAGLFGMISGFLFVRRSRRVLADWYRSDL